MKKEFAVLGIEAHDIGRQHIGSEIRRKLRNVCLLRPPDSSRGSSARNAARCVIFRQYFLRILPRAFFAKAGTYSTDMRGQQSGTDEFALRQNKLAGVDLVEPGHEPRVYQCDQRAGLAKAAGSPRDAAAATATAATRTAGATATARQARQPLQPRQPPQPRQASWTPAPAFLLVEQIERCQAHVGDFFLTKRDSCPVQVVLCRRYVGRRHGRCGCAAHHRERQSGGSQCRCGGFGHPLLLRSLFHPRHSRILHTL